MLVRGIPLLTPTMIRASRFRRSLLVSALVLAALLIGTTSAQARATVTRLTLTNAETLSGALPECLPADLIGNNVATDVTTVQIVDTGSRVFAVHGVDVLTYRVDFADSRYVLGQATGHFTFIAN